MCCGVWLFVVAQVIIGAPTVISEDLLRTFNISLVVRGSVTETRAQNSNDNDRCVRARWCMLLLLSLHDAVRQHKAWRCLTPC